ncbi:MICOS complex subunit mic25a isoform X1 [Sebastes umbrosus]|uniref:MICOS complex subunit mic25a isoform X1 n=1 Tax=Sebastes umbrosus TaxID=72105 RepID=UPI00189EDDAF|nr:MICOS complex subunit mic25a isoform X1 [Sebastes umbrosus]
MGSGESTTRKVSFGVDDEDRVRILRGVKLSEDVLQRMKGVANIAPERTSSSTSSPPKDTGAPRSPSSSSSSRPQQSPQHRAPPSTQSSTSKPASYAKDEQRRYERQQTILKEELAKVAQREKEAAREEMTKAMTRERQHKRQETENAKKLSADEINVMAQQLQKKDSQLKALDAFYKEQLEQLEKRGSERYEQSKDEFHQAASKTEANVRSRNTDPVCSGLQAQILSCYRENRDQTLRCSDLAKEYQRCINAAKKNLLVNHG